MIWEDGGGRSITYLLIQIFKEEQPSQSRMKEQNKGWKGEKLEKERGTKTGFEKDSKHKNQHGRETEREVESVITERSLLYLRGVKRRYEFKQKGEDTGWRTKTEKTLHSWVTNPLATSSGTIIKADSSLGKNGAAWAKLWANYNCFRAIFNVAIDITHLFLAHWMDRFVAWESALVNDLSAR